MRIAFYALSILLALSQTGCSEPPGQVSIPASKGEPATKERHRPDDVASVNVPEQSPLSRVALSPIDEKPAPKTEQEPKPPVVEKARKGDPEPDNLVSAKEIVSKTLPDLKLIRIPAGKFTMGSPATEKGRVDVEMQHEVSLTRDFYMGETHVTVGQWRAFQKATEHDAEAGAKPKFAQEDDHPAVEVNWEDAKAFCTWLSKEDGRVYRLPTEAG